MPCCWLLKRRGEEGGGWLGWWGEVRAVVNVLTLVGLPHFSSLHCFPACVCACVCVCAFCAPFSPLPFRSLPLVPSLLPLLLPLQPQWLIRYGELVVETVIGRGGFSEVRSSQRGSGEVGLCLLREGGGMRGCRHRHKHREAKRQRDKEAKRHARTQHTHVLLAAGASRQVARADCCH